MQDDLEAYLVDGEEVVITRDMHPICDGGSAGLGHPREFLTLERGLETVCKYCDRRYVHISHPEVDRFRKQGERFTP